MFRIELTDEELALLIAVLSFDIESHEGDMYDTTLEEGILDKLENEQAAM
jgi:hypothetical protein